MNPSFEIASFNYSGLVFNLVLKGKSISNELIFEHHGEHVSRPTCVAPYRQVLILLDVEHDLQAISSPSLHGGAQRLPLLCCVEHIALPISGEHLSEDREK